MKILTILGTRPEIIKLSRVMKCLDEHTEHIIVHTGQNYDYELNEIFFNELELRKPDYFLNAVGDTLADTMAAIIAKSDKVFEKEKPDALLVLGDTNSALSVIPAKRRKIPIFHMEAGNRCFDMRVPEEINRRIVDHVSDINLPYTEHARRNLIAEGIPTQRIIKTGSPQKEVLDYYKDKISISKVLTRLELHKKNYFVVSIHREENVDKPNRLALLIESLNLVAREYAMPVIFSTHPRTRERLNASGLVLEKAIRQMPPLGLFDYVALEQNSFCVISDSGTISEESSILGFPAITVRDAHERPEGMDEGTVIMCGIQAKRILEAIRTTVSQYESFGPGKIVEDYNVAQVSWKVTKTILSYTDYVNRTVWCKY